jgi:hypothetical protein
MTPREYVRKHRDEVFSEEGQLLDMFMDFCLSYQCYNCQNCPFSNGNACDDDDYWRNVAFKQYCKHDFECEHDYYGEEEY